MERLARKQQLNPDVTGFVRLGNRALALLQGGGDKLRSKFAGAQRFGPRPPSQGGPLASQLPHETIYLHGYEDSRPRVPWPAFPPQNYLGQLDPSFQLQLAATRAFVERADCDFYHTATLPNGEVIQGAWDLRGRETSYLGNADFAGQRVLELGPASGHISFFLERNGASVVGFDAGWDCSVDLLPRPGIDLGWAQMDVMRFIGAVQNSWWFLHRELGSSVPAVYGSIYSLPADIGVFDTSLFCAILLHLRDPFAALAQAADRTLRRLIVTEPLQDPDLDQDSNLMRFAPQDIKYPTHWWSFTPGAIVRMVERLGFPHHAVTYHNQLHHSGHDLSAPQSEMEMFTVVAQRA